MEKMINHLKSSALLPGSPGIFLPGELEWQKRQDYMTHGIPLDGPTRQSLKKAAQDAGLSYRIEL